MKLAFCLFRYFPYGGLQRDFLRIAAACLARGHTVDVYTMRWEGEKIAGLPVTIVPVTAWQNHTRIKQFIKKLLPLLTTKKYDRVVGFNRMPGLDFYYAADSCYQAKVRQQHGAWYRWLPRYRYLAANEAAVFSPAAKVQILLIAGRERDNFMRYYATPATRFHLLPPGITRDRIAPPDASARRIDVRAQLQLAPEALLLLFVGSGFKTKGLDRVLAGIARLPQALRTRAQLVVIGRDKSAAFIQQAQQLGLAEHVKFLGGRDDVAAYMLAADILVHPARNENTGTVLLEAVVAGLPVLTTAACGYALYITQAQAGKVLPEPFDVAQFSATLADMLISSQRLQWQQNGLAFAQQADIYSLPERAADMIESLS